MRTAALSLGFVLLDVGTAAAHQHFAAQVRPIGAEIARTSQEDAYQSGKAMLAFGNVPEALAEFRRALIADPQSTDALNGVGVCYDHLGRPDVSRAFYEAALVIAPDDPVTLNNYGFALVMAGDRAAARPLLERAAAGDLAEPRAAALRTLALLDAPQPTAVGDTIDPPADARVERTSEGEQRLVLASAGPTSGNLRSDDDRLAVWTEIGRTWSPADDERLVALEQSDARADAERAQAILFAAREAAEARATPTERASAPPSPAPTAVPPAQFAVFKPRSSTIAPERDRSWLLADARRTEARSDVRALAGPAIFTPAPKRFDASASAAAVEQRPPPERARSTVFDSDDEELNRFARRMQAGVGVGDRAARSRLAEQVRAA